MIMTPDPAMTGAATLVVGNEILLGRTQDTNTLFLAEFLLKKGIKLGRWVIVPDREDQIVSELRKLIHDGFDPIIVSGGMGPTHDDITVSAIAVAMDLPLERSPESYDRMTTKWRRRNPGKEFPKNAEEWLSKMSQVPRDFICIENDAGMAEGLMGKTKQEGGMIFILPGVPVEYRAIIESLSFLKLLPEGSEEELQISEIRFKGKESQIAGYLSDLQRSNQEIEIGSYPQGPKNVIIRITGPRGRIEMALPGLMREVSQLEENNQND